MTRAAVSQTVSSPRGLMNEREDPKVKKGRRYNVVPKERSDFHLSLSPAPDFNAAVRAPTCLERDAFPRFLTRVPHSANSDTAS